MSVMCLTDVNQGQHHHDERLKQNDQNVEQPPAKAGKNLAEHAQRAPEHAEAHGIAAEQSNQEEEQFTCVHVAKESHAETDGLSKILNDIQRTVKGPQQEVVAERSREQLVEPTACTFNLKAVVQTQEKHGDGDTHRAIQVCRRQRTQVVDAEKTSDSGQQVDRNQVDCIHQHDPDENRQCTGSDKGTIAVHNRFTLFFHHIHKHFNGALELARHTARRILCGAAKQPQRNNKHEDREEDGVVVDDRKVND